MDLVEFGARYKFRSYDPFLLHSWTAFQILLSRTNSELCLHVSFWFRTGLNSVWCQINWSSCSSDFAWVSRIRRAISQCVQAEMSSRNLTESGRNRILFTIFLIDFEPSGWPFASKSVGGLWIQSDFGLI